MQTTMGSRTLWTTLARINKYDWKKQARNLAIISVGICIYAIGFTVFILPHSIVIGGMAGFSTLVYYASAGVIPVAVTMYVVNILLLAAGGKVLGKGFVLRTIFGATLLSVLIGFMEGYFTSHPPLITSTPMSVMMGSVLLGLGIGIYYGHHGTCGGTDIIAAIMAHKTQMSMGRVMLIVDISIVALSFFLPFDGDMEARIQVRTETIIYGWLSILIYSLLADKYVAAGRQTVQFIILSDRWEQIADRITRETGRGITFWEGKGYWTKAPRTMMMLWCRKYDTHHIYSIIKEEDQNAYITSTNVRSLYGNGFDHLRIRK
ncbi:MAG: YitT family protein [Bacteroidales bacterium]|nr:YitT family protein [Bacteroidales bacterium]